MRTLHVLSVQIYKPLFAPSLKLKPNSNAYQNALLKSVYTQAWMESCMIAARQMP